MIWVTLNSKGELVYQELSQETAQAGFEAASQIVGQATHVRELTDLSTGETHRRVTVELS